MKQINQAATSSAGCLCAQIPALGFRAWFPIPAERRLAWGGEGRAISVAVCATDLTLCGKCRRFTYSAGPDPAGTSAQAIP